MKDLLFQTRAQLGVSVQTISDYLGVSSDCWRKWEDGINPVPIAWVAVMKSKFKWSWSVVGAAISHQYPTKETHKRLIEHTRKNRSYTFTIHRQRELSKIKKRRATLRKEGLRRRNQMLKLLVQDIQAGADIDPELKKLVAPDELKKLLADESHESKPEAPSDSSQQNQLNQTGNAKPD